MTDKIDRTLEFLHLDTQHFYGRDWSEDVCDFCEEMFKVSIGHWCNHPSAPFNPMERWSGERMYRCEASKTRLVIDLRRVRQYGPVHMSRDFKRGTSEPNGWLAVLLPPKDYVAAMALIHADEGVSAAEAVLLITGVRVSLDMAPFPGTVSWSMERRQP